MYILFIIITGQLLITQFNEKNSFVFRNFLYLIVYFCLFFLFAIIAQVCPLHGVFFTVGSFVCCLCTRTWSASFVPVCSLRFSPNVGHVMQ